MTSRYSVVIQRPPPHHLRQVKTYHLLSFCPILNVAFVICQNSCDIIMQKKFGRLNNYLRPNGWKITTINLVDFESYGCIKKMILGNMSTQWWKLLGGREIKESSQRFGPYIGYVTYQIKALWILFAPVSLFLKSDRKLFSKSQNSYIICPLASIY